MSFGNKYGEPTPFNSKVVEIIKACESGKLKPSFENVKLFDELFAK